MNYSSEPTYSVLETIHFSAWVIKEWKIAFVFSERQLAEIKKLSRLSNWYEDPVEADTYIERLSICFHSVEEVYSTLGILPQVGDRLFNGETGMIVQDRSFDGNLKTITFTLSV
ncbi:hypothetical protein [Spirosoma pollinicola]|uniref:Uncharacterized protein n=1 Tax=Spirosoma pollinicola TaxID=2057025 RepID=A0A2K8ZB07_9BACT|nr:hypothetical protein [Spirosoma pollinicola]AUD07048.1 hypothetical protein CWM47_37660 [Spirosoma pollinicola]